MKEIIKQILEVAVNAPSGENAQPWRFEVRGNEISIFNVPERDQSLYNFSQKGSLVAHGALIENISITAPMLGCGTKINLLPDPKDSNLIATVSLDKLLSQHKKEKGLYSSIIKRSTNRKPYKKIPLNNNQLNELQSVVNEVEGGRIVFIKDGKKMKEVSGACSINEQVMFENKFIHNFFFDHINWTEKEELDKKLGFYIKTLELPLPIQFMLRLLKYWSVMNFLNKLRLNKVIAKGNAATYSNASAMAAFVVNGDTQKNFIIAGRLMQRLWLKATELGLSAQPMAGMLFFMQAINGGENGKFSASQVELIKNAYKNVKNVFGVNSEAIVMILRIGHGGEPSARSSKLPPKIVFED